MSCISCIMYCDQRERAKEQVRVAGVGEGGGEGVGEEGVGGMGGMYSRHKQDRKTCRNSYEQSSRAAFSAVERSRRSRPLLETLHYCREPVQSSVE